ncbi:MAG: hypothetical protein ABDH31_04145 [Chlorobiota bacterium]
MWWLAVVYGLWLVPIASAQFVEDALRLAQLDGYITPRAGGIGIGFAALADDIGALYYNPAGLVLLPGIEISGGLFFSRNAAETNFLATRTSAASNSAAVTHLGAATVDRWGSTRVGVAVAYAMDNDYETSFRYAAFNPTSSIVAAWTKESENPRENWAFRLYLADTINGRMSTPLQDSLFQEAFVRERGGLHSLAGGVGFELAPWVSLGFSVALKYGRFSYSRNYRESDIYNRYNWLDTVGFTNVDFDILELRENLTQELSGITGGVGLLVRVGEFLRAGAVVHFPTFFQVRERFAQKATATFDDGDRASLTEEGQNSYNVRTPFVFSGATAFHLSSIGLTFTAGVAFSDVTQLEFTDAPWEVLALNDVISQQLVGQTIWGAAVEWMLPLLPLTLRASYNSITSPYARDIPGATTVITALGAGLYLAPNIRLDFVARRLELSELRTSYSAQSLILTRTPLTLAAGLTYRY